MYFVNYCLPKSASSPCPFPLQHRHRLARRCRLFVCYTHYALTRRRRPRSRRDRPRSGGGPTAASGRWRPRPTAGYRDLRRRRRTLSPPLRRHRLTVPRIRRAGDVVDDRRPCRRRLAPSPRVVAARPLPSRRPTLFGVRRNARMRTIPLHGGSGRVTIATGLRGGRPLSR